MAVTVNKMNTVAKIEAGRYWECMGYLTWGTSDTYATGGFDVRADIKKMFGTGQVIAMDFPNGLSDGAGATTIQTAEATARYDYTTGKIKLYVIGRVSGTPGSACAPGTEVSNGASLNAGRLDFVALCGSANVFDPIVAYS